MADQKILKRSEVPEEYTWNLKDMFESDEAWLAEYEALKAFPAEVAKYQGKLGESAENLLAYFKGEDELTVRLENIYNDDVESIEATIELTSKADFFDRLIYFVRILFHKILSFFNF